MCEINSKKVKIFKIEFFTSHEISDEKWNKLILKRLLKLEEEFNLSGEIRIHIHEGV